MKIAKTALLVAGFAWVGMAHAGEGHYSNQLKACAKQASTDEARFKCDEAEIALQKKRLNTAYTRLAGKLSAGDKAYLDKVQHEWITWRDDNYELLAEHVPGESVTVRTTSLNFLMDAIYDRASQLEMMLDEIGGQ
jgi:uncharacterized protein YecT (DUF1311 family)